MYRPRYETSVEVSAAVAEGKIPFLKIMAAYQEAADYQAELKRLKAKRFFRRPSGQPKPLGLNNRPGYATP